MLRLLAMLTMLIDHIGVIFFPDDIILRIVGRLAFPLFAWGIARGYRYTSSLKRYAIRLLALGIISQYPYMTLFQTQTLNICITFFISIIALKLYDSENRLVSLLGPGSLFIAILLLEIVSKIKLEYGLYGVLTVMGFHIFWRDWSLVAYQGLLTLISSPLYSYHMIQLYSVIASPLVIILEKRDFKLNKTIQYGFYPLHIIILLVIKSI